MELFTGVDDYLQKQYGDTLIHEVLNNLPEDFTSNQRDRLESSLLRAVHHCEKELLAQLALDKEDIEQKIRDLEGTTRDLEGSGGWGAFIRTVRAAQRPIWGYAVLLLDLMVFSGQWNLVSISADMARVMGRNAPYIDLESAFWLINLLVLGFLFGERAVRNVIPVFHRRFGGSSPPTTQG